jgi:hypothetical protein
MLIEDFPDDGCRKCEGLLKRYITLLLDARLWLAARHNNVAKTLPHAVAYA